MQGYTRSKNNVNSSGDALSPYFTPKFAKNSRKSPDSSSTHLPLDYTYIFFIILTKSGGIFKHSTSAFQSFSRLILSYACFKSIKHSPIYLLVRILYCNSVYKMSAYSIVLWWALNPAYVGACSFFSSAVTVSLLFITAINSLDSSGATAILLQFSGLLGSPLPLYSGVTLEVRHCVGASCSMAHLLNNNVRHCIPAGPMCFNT